MVQRSKTGKRTRRTVILGGVKCGQGEERKGRWRSEERICRLVGDKGRRSEAIEDRVERAECW